MSHHNEFGFCDLVAMQVAKYKGKKWWPLLIKINREARLLVIINQLTRLPCLVGPN